MKPCATAAPHLKTWRRIFTVMIFVLFFEAPNVTNGQSLTRKTQPLFLDQPPRNETCNLLNQNLCTLR